MEISTKDLEVFLEGTRIIKGMSVEIKEKEFVGILGPNGSGKSTLLKCIYRVLHPKSGKCN